MDELNKTKTRTTLKTMDGLNYDDPKDGLNIDDPMAKDTMTRDLNKDGSVDTEIMASSVANGDATKGVEAQISNDIAEINGAMDGGLLSVEVGSQASGACGTIVDVMSVSSIDCAASEAPTTVEDPAIVKVDGVAGIVSFEEVENSMDGFSVAIAASTGVGDVVTTGFEAPPLDNFSLGIPETPAQQ